MRRCVPGISFHPTGQVPGSDTSTVADADLVESAALVAFTVNVPAAPGAVYRPEAVMLPPVAVQFTAVLALPVTVAVNCLEVLTCKLAVVGETATDTAAGVGVGVGVGGGGVGPGVGVGVGVGAGGGVGVGVEGGGVETETVAKSDRLASAWLVAVTVNVPAELGAVYIPAEETVPPVAVQSTAVSDVPLTLTVNCSLPLTFRELLCGLTTTETEAGVVEVELPLELVPKPQPPMARTSWRRKTVNTKVKMLWRLNKFRKAVELPGFFMGCTLKTCLDWWCRFIYNSKFRDQAVHLFRKRYIR